jgi:hypothetical protein
MGFRLLVRISNFYNQSIYLRLDLTFAITRLLIQLDWLKQLQSSRLIKKGALPYRQHPF